jgi:hypothetical protein
MKYVVTYEINSAAYRCHAGGCKQARDIPRKRALLGTEFDSIQAAKTAADLDETEKAGKSVTASWKTCPCSKVRNKNPVREVPNPYAVKQADINKAYKLYREFRESPPDRGRVVEFEMPRTLMVMGNVKAIEYDTTRGRALELYRHDFAAGSRPLLCADAATGALFFIEGRYRVTKRGIVDLDPNGKEIDD